MSFYVSVISYVGIYGILAMSFTLVHGTAGMFTVAHAAFFGIGAYGTALLTPLLGPGFVPVGIVAGSLLAAAFAAIIGLAALRERGQYLMLVTFSVQIIFSVAALNLPFTGGDNGIGGIAPLGIGGLTAKHPIAAMVVVLALVVAIYFLLRYIERSSLGRLLRAIREDEYAAEALGADVFAAKMFAFVASAGLAGFAGAVFAHHASYINPVSFSFEVAILIVTISVLGGQYSLLGAIVGALVVVWLPYVIDFLGIESVKVSAITQLIYGLVLIFVLFIRPSGMVPEQLRGFHPPAQPGAER
ncbi:MAG: metal-dependent hydrolase [Alphaproteobacteria bacterium]|jgi:branched-chain amino acid transport system permease protein|nr:metal-dependent hydrolase [Alphaproteobacteria bacterium]